MLPHGYTHTIAIEGMDFMVETEKKTQGWFMCCILASPVLLLHYINSRHAHHASADLYVATCKRVRYVWIEEGDESLLYVNFSSTKYFNGASILHSVPLIFSLLWSKIFNPFRLWACLQRRSINQSRCFDSHLLSGGMKCFVLEYWTRSRFADRN